jgi:hypothetical protein
MEEFERQSNLEKNFIEFLKNGPLFEGLDLERDSFLGREFEF